MSLQRKTPLRRTGGLKRTPMKRENTERAAKRRAEAFGEQAELCRWIACVACRQEQFPEMTPGDWGLHAKLSLIEHARCRIMPPRCDPHHEPTRAAGGKDKDTVPLCREHHDERHRIGRAAFEAKHGVDLRAVARAIHDELETGK
jgi:hypothetical protein